MNKVPGVIGKPNAISRTIHMASIEKISKKNKGLSSLVEGSTQKFVFFGGKGGVGKTSSSAATAIHLADQGFSTLIISTDPAHSLGDALEQDISGGDLVKVLGVENLVAMEVDTKAAIKEFQEALEGIDLVQVAHSLGLPEEIIQNLGLKEMVGILRNPPPGLDELIALAKVVRVSKGQEGNQTAFERVIIDTAPTGHTLRLLAFPEFLDGFLGKIVKLRSKIQGILNTFKGFFSDGGENVTARTEEAISKLENFKNQMNQLRQLFHNSESTEFVIVTIATHLAVAESSRLLTSLQKEKISVNNLIINQLLSPDISEAYINRLNSNQQHGVEEIEKWCSTKYPDITVSKVPYFDMEVIGISALKYMGKTAFSCFSDFNEAEKTQAEPKFVILGGKGGVGKTSSASSLAVTFAEQGLNTVIVSTDPAHSVGDAFQTDLSSGKLVEISGIMGSGRLFALEVDTEEAMAEFKATVQAFSQDESAVLKQFSEFADVLDTAPPGTDELVALAKVLDLVKGGDNKLSAGIKFDRIVVDTAPTGHTLRLLSFPDFIGDFFERLIRIRDRLKASSVMFNLVSQALSQEAGMKSKKVSEAKDRLREIQLKVFELEELFKDETQTQFVVVTIPTALALAESKRLVSSLREQDILVNKIILNQIFTDKKDMKSYFSRLSVAQAKEVHSLEKLENDEISITKVPYFDTEVTNVYGLRAMGKVMFPEQR